MRFVKCGSKLFRPDAVTAVQRHYTVDSGPSVMVATQGMPLIFTDEEAEVVWAFFSHIPTTDLLRRDEDEPTEAVADNHTIGEC
jgi:hypothetical protein